MRPFNLILRCFFCLLVFQLGACSNAGADALWQDYQQRLLRLAGDGLSPVERTITARPRWPAPRQLQRPVPQWRTDLFGWLDLIDCDLSTLVAERNSGMGRVQHPSLRLAYEIEFVTQARQCLSTLATDDDMRPWLAEAVAGKEAALPALFWNATLGSPEWRESLAPQSVPAAPPLPINGPALAATVSDWAAQLPHVAQGNAPGIDALETQLQALTSNHPGLLTDALRLGTDALRQNTAVLVQVDTQWLCPNGRASTRARYFHNVFSNVYGLRVQPWLSAVWRESATFAGSLDTLRNALPADASGEAVRLWIDQWLQLRENFRLALDQHVRAWQSLLGDCGLMPGQAPLASAGDNAVGTANDADARQP